MANSLASHTATEDARSSEAAKVVAARFGQQKIAWHGCRAGPDDELGKGLDAVKARCGEVVVPLDYSRPDGRTIKVAMAWRKATDQAHRLGTLMLNGGGPDASMETVSIIPPVAPTVAARYDLVSTDPRFLGRSTPLNCGWPASAIANSAGPNRETFDQGAATAKDLANRCTSHKSLLPHASTRNIARDMDVVRTALGEKKVSYLGWSYGTYLGAVYAQLFPEHLDRVVLDSALDPDLFGPGVTRPTGSVMTAALRDWAGWAASHDSTYHLGRTTVEVLATVDRINQAATRRPLTVGSHQVSNHLLVTAFLQPSDITPEAYAELATKVKVLSDAARGVKVTPPPAMESMLTLLASSVVADALSAEMAVKCADRAASRDPETYFRDIQAHRGDEPVFGPLTRNLTPCAFWPADPAEPPTTVHNHVPALITGSAVDPSTPYPGQLNLHRALTGSRMITLRGSFTHGVYLFYGNTCVDTAVNRYLLGGSLPATDTTCTTTKPADTPTKS